MQLNLPNKMQITSHTFSLFHKHLHMILSDNAMNALVADLILALFKEQIHSFIPRHNFHQTDCFANKKGALIYYMLAAELQKSSLKFEGL